MSKFFINRPIVAMVIAIVTVIVGIVTIAIDERKYGHVKDTSSHVEDISRNVSTSNLPDWPQNIAAVRKLIKNLEPGDQLVVDCQHRVYAFPSKNVSTNISMT